MMPPRRETIDCQRLLCPMPVIRVQDRIAQLSRGDELTAICTDPGVFEDIPAWCRINGHEVVSSVKREGELLVTVRVGR
jgi:tRNA 2-thiouridine synthesizing protein A